MKLSIASRMRRVWRAFSLGPMVGLGIALVPQGCGGVQPVTEVPETIADPLRACAVEHKRHVSDVEHTVKFDVKLDSDGQVDSIVLIESTVGDEELEKCMVASIRSLTEDDLLLRQSENFGRDSVQPESRMLVGNPGVVAAACLASPPCLLTLTLLMGASVITVQLMVHAATVKPTTTTTSPPIAVPRRWPGQTCENAELDRLEAEKKKLCKPDGGFAATCGGGNINTNKLPFIPCSAIKLSLQQRRACKAARWLVQDKCFGGKPNAGHKDQIDQVQNGIDHCEALEPINCAKGHPMANL